MFTHIFPRPVRELTGPMTEYIERKEDEKLEVGKRTRSRQVYLEYLEKMELQGEHPKDENDKNNSPQEEEDEAVKHSRWLDTIWGKMFDQ